MLKGEPNSSPTVGIVIANYNKAAFLPQCLDSVFEQTYPRVKVVVVDDASTDDSMGILEVFQERHANLRVIKLEENRGVAHARNVAIDALDCDWVTTLDSDDVYLHPEKLEREVQLACSDPKKRTIGFSGVQKINVTGKAARHWGRRPRILERALFEEILTRECFIPRDFICSRQALLDAGGYDPSLDIYEDWDLKIRLAESNWFLYSGVCGIGYRQTGRGLSAISRAESIQRMYRVFDRYVDRAEDPDALRARLEKSLEVPLGRRIVSTLFPKYRL